MTLDLGAVVLAFVLAGLLGLGVGRLNCVLFGFFPTWRNIWSVLTRPLFLISGIFFIFESVPASFQAMLWCNPLVHVIALMRAGFYGTYDPQFVSYAYVLGVALGAVRGRRLPAAPARELPDRAMSPAPAVSVITPVWNAAATLAATVASVRAQSFADWEMLLVDDGSTDGSRALAERLAAAEPRLRLLGWAAQSRRGGGAQRRHPRGAAAASSPSSTPTTSGARRSSRCSSATCRATGVPFSFAAYRRIDADGRPLGVVRGAGAGRPCAAAQGQRHPLP